MFAIVSVQNILLDYAQAATDITRWEVQVNVKRVAVPGEQIYEEVMQCIVAAEEEDIREETDPKWYRPRVQKKVRKSNRWVSSKNEWHDAGTYFSFVGLRRDLLPVQFGQDQEILEKVEKEGFATRQRLLVEHYECFSKKSKANFWLRS